MIFVIMPLGEAALQVSSWLLQVAVYVAASTIGGALTGFLLAAIGGFLGLYVGLLAPLLALLALLYALHELRIITLPLPNRAWQVPASWLRRSKFGGTLAFGLVLGSGLFTFVEFGSFYVLLLWELALAAPTLGAIVGGIYGLVRGVPVVLGGISMLAGRDPIRLNLLILNDVARVLHRIDGLLLLFVASFLVGSVLNW